MGIGYSKKSKKIEVILWSVALPGFGQLLNRKYIKGILLIGLVFLVHVMGNLNTIIMLSINFKIVEAIAETNYMWILFYPCLYFFSIWDAFKDAGGGENKPFAFLPLVFSAYLATVGLILSPKFTLFGYLVGPIWLSILFLTIGSGIGVIIRWILLKRYSKETI